jgi:hypothetical protein
MSALSHIPDVLLALLWVLGYCVGAGVLSAWIVEWIGRDDLDGYWGYLFLVPLWPVVGPGVVGYWLARTPFRRRELAVQQKRELAKLEAEVFGREP